MSKILWDIGAFIVSISILTFVHEFGHFCAARCCNVQVERFSIGFGKAIWKYINKQGTEFSIAIIPLGGYVKMFYQEKELTELSSRAFNNKTISQRAAIIIAGPVFNIIFSILIYWLIFIIGMPSIRPIVGEVISNSIAANAKIMPGMELKSIDGVKITDWDTFRLQLAAKIGKENTIINVSSFGSNKQEEKILDLRHWTLEYNNQDLITSIGIFPHDTQIKPILTKVLKNSAANKAGLQIGDKITKVNGNILTHWVMFVNLVRNNPGKSLILDVERGGNSLSFTLIPDKKLNRNKIEGFAGVTPKILPLSEEYHTIYRYHPFIAAVKAINKTHQLINLIIHMLGRLITFSVKLSNLNGPIFIAQEARISAAFGGIYYFTFLALISINFGIINLFPLPVLDGGHLLFLMIEKLKGGIVSKKVQNISYRIGSILLIMLMVFTIFNDFSHL